MFIEKDKNIEIKLDMITLNNLDILCSTFCFNKSELIGYLINKELINLKNGKLKFIEDNKQNSWKKYNEFLEHFK